MRLLLIWALAVFLPPVLGVMHFISPPAAQPHDSISDNPVFTEGTTVNVSWSPPDAGKSSSLSIIQMNKTSLQGLGIWTLITDGVLGGSNFTWTVTLSVGQAYFDLDVSNVFTFNIWEEGKQLPDGNSRFFNITPKAQVTTSSDPVVTATSTSQTASSNTMKPTTAAPLSSPISSSTTPSPAENTSANASANNDASSSSNSDLSTGAKAGIGVGIIAAVVLGLLAGWLLFANRKRSPQPYPPPHQFTDPRAAGHGYGHHGYDYNNNYNNGMGGAGGWPPQSNNTRPVPIAEMGTDPKHFELHAP
ncbi:hypothetical protein B0H66DRAFT_547193 [Apodospora peruviana]|uniref:Mid2 domain-containing protein n=1 Tax=Apodospora peruviana TaxID=516989 RepID=A0AAE0IHU5_9PEZI|nr:hypothetical protein B0H66DRAFT_547193 [Apodospora peruviana]